LVSNHFTALLKLKNYKSYVEENKKYFHVFFVCSEIAKLKRLTADIRCALRAWPSAHSASSNTLSLFKNGRISQIVKGFYRRNSHKNININLLKYKLTFYLISRYLFLDICDIYLFY
jgi:hypothetical protein